ncbi:MAG TPA: hypothetical protein VKI44_05415 [Acetobacteraceae bacterium]|nr:hypothetical protein [Acetobacteraceae bacterium]
MLAEARSKFADMAPGELESLIDEAAAAARKGSARWAVDLRMPDY